MFYVGKDLYEGTQQRLIEQLDSTKEELEIWYTELHSQVNNGSLPQIVWIPIAEQCERWVERISMKKNQIQMKGRR